jgi:type II secretory pathway component GspD/PulD (secretin)
MNFRGVSLDMVLNYLSDAAGFIIVLETKVEGKVDVWSNQPLTKDEAVDLLNSILNQNDCAAIRNGRTLTIVKKKDAKMRNIPVKRNTEPENIPKTEEMVTQIIAVRNGNAAQLTKDLQPLLADYAQMTANESANTLVLTATQTDVRRMAEIVAALDESISGNSVVKVFPLRFADSKELATVVKELFQPTTTQGQGNNRGGGGCGGGGGFPGFGGGGGFPGGGFPGGGGGGNRGGGGGNSSSAGNSTARVVAVADERSNSLVVSAPEQAMNMIKQLIAEVDVSVADVTELRVFHLTNADPVEVSDMLSGLFPDDTRSDNNNNQQQFAFRGPFGGAFGGRNNANTQGANSERMKKKGRVLSVPDQRTASVIVSADQILMPQIAEMIAQLDSNPAKRQKVFVYSLENADVQQVEQLLRGMFERSTTQSRNNNQNQNSALTTRSTANQQNMSTTGTGTSGFGSSGVGSSGGSGTGNAFR